MLNNQKGFTLIEMLIVLMIISVLIILIVPNLGKKGKEVNEKGCHALVSVVQAQTDAYILEKGSAPTSLDVLVNDGYIKEEQKTCSNNKVLSINAAGKVTQSE